MDGFESKARDRAGLASQGSQEVGGGFALGQHDRHGITLLRERSMDHNRDRNSPRLQFKDKPM
jgi:hypothetical protein